MTESYKSKTKSVKAWGTQLSESLAIVVTIEVLVGCSANKMKTSMLGPWVPVGSFKPSFLSTSVFVDFGSVQFQYERFWRRDKNVWLPSDI